MEAIKQARELAEEILNMTKALVLTGIKDKAEEEAEAYATLMDEREPLIDELSDLGGQLDEEERSTPEFEELVQIIKEITTLDKKNVETVKKMHESAQSSYKEVKQGQRINAGYNPLPSDEASSTINIKQ